MDPLAYMQRLRTLSDLALAEEFRKQTAETAGAVRAEIVVRWLRTVGNQPGGLKGSES